MHTSTALFYKSSFFTLVISLFKRSLAYRLELELERDKRERDARERELRERELREMEMREKMKAEMDLKPPGMLASKQGKITASLALFPLVGNLPSHQGQRTSSLQTNKLWQQIWCIKNACVITLLMHFIISKEISCLELFLKTTYKNGKKLAEKIKVNYFTFNLKKLVIRFILSYLLKHVISFSVSFNRLKQELFLVTLYKLSLPLSINI